MQDTYPYITEYGITPVNILIGADTVRLYFIACAVTANGADGYVYFNIYKETDIFNKDNIEPAVKAYFTEWERIIASGDQAAAIKESAIFGADMLVSESIADAIGLNSSFVIKDADTVTNINDMSYDEVYSKDIKHFALVNAFRYAAASSDNVHTKAELDAFRSTFFYIIKQHSYEKVTDDTVTGKLYNAVINYYAGGGADVASGLIDLVLSSSYSYDASSSASSCGCNSSSSSYSVNEPCATKYNTAMETWVKTMLADIIYFYNKFFYTEKQSETTQAVCYEPDADLIDALVKLIDEFTAAGYDLSFNTTSKFNICACNSSTASSASDCNYNTLSDYKKLLSYIKENNVSGNENKIKAYGASMGAVVVKMMF